MSLRSCWLMVSLILLIPAATPWAPTATVDGLAPTIAKPSPTITATATSITSGTPTTTVTPKPVATLNKQVETPVPSIQPTSKVTLTPTPTATPSATGLPTGTATPTSTGQPTTSATATSTAQPTASVTSTPTATITATATAIKPPTTTPSPLPGTLSNDDIGSAFRIDAFPFSASQDTTKASVATDDPDMGSGTRINSNTVWFMFVAPSSGGVRANTSGSDYDTVIAAFTGQRGSLSLIASNDDISFGIMQSQIAFNVQAGISYYLEVAQYGGTSKGGLLYLSVELGDAILPTQTAVPTATSVPSATATTQPGGNSAPPSNDDFDSAISIDSLPFTSNLDSTGAQVAQDDPNMGVGYGSNSHTVWYRYIASSSGRLQADTFGSDYDTVLAAFTGVRGQLSIIATNDDAPSNAPQSLITFDTQPGVTYHLEVAQYGNGDGGQLRFNVGWVDSVGASTPTIVPLTAQPTPYTMGIQPSTPPSIPPGLLHPKPLIKDERYFKETGYRINLDPFWDYFQKRGGVQTFGYPISWEFPLLGFRVQFYQRGILQLMPDRSVATMNLLDDGLMPYTRINFSTFPGPDRELHQEAPLPSDPDYADKAISFLLATVPDYWEGMEVSFLKSYLNTVRNEDAFPFGEGDPSLIPLLNLELWGLPTSLPARDPNNHSFVYQRFQRGILMYDDITGNTQGLLLADYLKSLITGEGLPYDLEIQARRSRFYRQYDRSKPGSLARPTELLNTNLQGAFEPSNQP